jgi:GNAT superfamily N-acetyltransferase
MQIRELHPDEQAWANATYRAIRFAENDASVCVALVAELAPGERVGLGRLVELEPGVHELGGIWTAESARGRGVARAIVTALLARATTPLWCIPFVHLAGFYGAHGFEPAPGPWPASVARKVAACGSAALPDVCVLRRHS